MNMNSPLLDLGRLPIPGLHFVGRDSELARLDAAWEGPHGHVLAFGGVGKSALYPGGWTLCRPPAGAGRFAGAMPIRCRPRIPRSQGGRTHGRLGQPTQAGKPAPFWKRKGALAVDFAQQFYPEEQMRESSGEGPRVRRDEFMRTERRHKNATLWNGRSK